MLTQPDNKVLRSMYSLSQRTGWDDIDKFLNDELVKTHEFLVGASDIEKVRQLQGRAQFIRDFLDTVRDARKLLEKLGDNSL